MAGRQRLGPFTDMVFPVIQREGGPMRQNIDYNGVARKSLFLCCERCGAYLGLEEHTEAECLLHQVHSG